MATSTTENFVPELNRVLNSTETVTLEATSALKGRGIDTEVENFEGDVKGKIAETRARLNGLPANAVSSAPANSTLDSTTKQPRVNISPISTLASASDKLNLLKVLNKSLINTIQQVITQMGAGNTDFIRRALGYIQILLIQLQNLVVIFNRLDKRLSKIEKNLGMGRNTSTNTPQPDLEALRKQLEELMRLAPTPPTAPAPARTGWFGNPFARKKGGYSRKLSKIKRKAPAITRKRAGHKKASRKK